MKEMLIQEVQRQMLPFLTNDQLLKLQDAMQNALQNLTINKDEGYCDSCPDTLEPFIGAKRVDSGETS